MNKRSITAMRILAAISLIGVVYADNAASQDSSLSRWTGFYTGMNAGFVFNHVQLRSQQLGFTNLSERCNTSADFSTFFPGIQWGYVHQFANDFVSGIETNLTVNTRQKDSLSCPCSINPEVSDRFSFKNQGQFSIKGRGGLSLNSDKGSLLPYLTTGVSFTHAELAYANEGGDFYSQHTTRAGWLLGAGLEWAFRKNWSLRAEYVHMDYGNVIKLKLPSVYGLVDTNGNARVNLTNNTISLAVNYWI